MTDFIRIKPCVEIIGKLDGGAIITARMDCADFDAAMEFMDHIVQFLKDRALANSSAAATAAGKGTET